MFYLLLFFFFNFFSFLVCTWFAPTMIARVCVSPLIYATINQKTNPKNNQHDTTTQKGRAVWSGHSANDPTRICQEQHQGQQTQTAE